MILYDFVQTKRQLTKSYFTQNFASK